MSAWCRVIAARALLVFVALAAYAAASLAASPQLALTVDLDPATRVFTAVAELAAPGPYAFELHRSLAVRSVTVESQSVQITSTPANDQRVWRVSVPKGSRLRIEYGGTLPALDAALGHRDVLRGLAPMASIQGSLLPAGRGWYPRPAERFSYSVRLSLPSDQRGIVPGRLVTETLPGATSKRYVAQFELDTPADGIDLMAGPYVVREKLVQRERAAPLRLRTYFYSDLDTLAEGFLEDSARYIALCSEAIGKYPYDSFSVVAGPLPTGFGMPTLTYLGAQVLKLPFIRSTSLGHEVLHNWWGNGVHVDYAKGNWSEGLTTFMADYFYKERESVQAAREMRLSWLRDFAAVPGGGHLPLTAFRSRTHGAEAAVGYGKAAMLFVMLRDAIGEEAFRRGVAAFWEKHKFAVAGWEDLRAAFEAASGRSLATFFEQWLRRAGGPGVTIESVRAAGAGGKTRVTLSMRQAAPAYTLSVPIEFIAADKSETRTVAFDRERQDVMLELPYRPDRVRLDPDLRLWRELHPAELPPILRQWIIARTPHLLVASSDASVGAAAETLAAAFFEKPPNSVREGDVAGSRDPLLVIGLHGDVDALLARLRLPLRPAALGERGTAQVWTVAGTHLQVAVISARDTEALKSLMRPLPHYGAQSYVIFDGSRAIARGAWPGETPVIAVR